MLLTLKKVIHHEKMQPWYLWNPGWIYAIGKHCQSLEMDMLIYRITFLSFSISLRAPPACFFHTGTYSALRLTCGKKCWRLHYNGNKHTHNSDTPIPSQIPSVDHSGHCSRKKGYISVGWMELTGGGNLVGDICHQWPVGLWELYSLKKAIDAFCRCDGFKQQR